MIIEDGLKPKQTNKQINKTKQTNKTRKKPTKILKQKHLVLQQLFHNGMYEIIQQHTATSGEK